MEAIQPAMWTNGPCFPTFNPLQSIAIIPRDLLKKVLQLNIFGILSPERIAFI